MTKTLGNTKYFFKYYKKPILIISIITVLFFSLRAFALTDEEYNDSNSILKFCYSMVDTIVGTDEVSSVSDKVAIEFTDDGVIMGGYDIKGLSSLIKEINNLSLALAICVISITFFAGFLNTRDQDLNEDNMLRSLVLWGIGICLCASAMTLCFWTANIGTGVAQKIIEIAGTGESAADTASVISTIKSLMYAESHVTGASGWKAEILQGLSNMMTPIGYVLQLIIPWIAMKVVHVVISVICWGRGFEILTLAAFSPLAFSDMIDTQRFGQGSGSRFMRNFAALALSGAIIVTVLTMCGRVYVSVLGEAAGVGTFSAFADATWNIVVIGFAEVGLVSKAQSMAKTLCGVG